MRRLTIANRFNNSTNFASFKSGSGIFKIEKYKKNNKRIRFVNVANDANVKSFSIAIDALRYSIKSEKGINMFDIIMSELNNKKIFKNKLLFNVGYNYITKENNVICLSLRDICCNISDNITAYFSTKEIRYNPYGDIKSKMNYHNNEKYNRKKYFLDYIINTKMKDCENKHLTSRAELLYKTLPEKYTSRIIDVIIYEIMCLYMASILYNILYKENKLSFIQSMYINEINNEKINSTYYNSFHSIFCQMMDTGMIDKYTSSVFKNATRFMFKRIDDLLYKSTVMNKASFVKLALSPFSFAGVDNNEEFTKIISTYNTLISRHSYF